MADIIPPFLVRYSGKGADDHILEAQEYGESIVGASKLYNSVVHYVMFGDILHPRTKKQLLCFAKPSEPGSVDQWLFVASAVAGNYGIDAAIYQEVLQWSFCRVMNAIKETWVQPSSAEKTIGTLSDEMQEKAAADSNMQILLVNGMLKMAHEHSENIASANERMASLHEKLIEKLPELATKTRSNGRKFVSPVGSSCSSIRQFAETQYESDITEPDAEVIRGNEDMEVEEMKDYKANMISEINLNTGHCTLEIEGIDRPVSGQISDPALGSPGNIYTRSLDSRSGFTVTAKAVKKGGKIQRLHISDAKG